MTFGEFQGKLDIYPIGTIITFTGNLSEIPEGWVFCDGNNGTPDLRNKFLKSVPNTSTDPGSTGGTNSKSLSTSQLPSHNHSTTVDGTSGDHGHSYGFHEEGYDGPGELYTNSSKGGYEYQDENWSHSHSINTNNTGGNGGFDNQPPYFKVAFIKKISE